MPSRTSPSSPIEQTICHKAVFTTRRPTPTQAVIAVRGELDAANAMSLAELATVLSESAEHLVIDLTDIQFFSTAGFSTLHTISVGCAGKSVDWAVVPSPAVNRVLRICDPDAALPIHATVDSALIDPAHPSSQAIAAGL